MNLTSIPPLPVTEEGLLQACDVRGLDPLSFVRARGSSQTQRVTSTNEIVDNMRTACMLFDTAPSELSLDEKKLWSRLHVLNNKRLWKELKDLIASRV